ncbi:MAG: hypothetical protein ACE37E_09485 [Hyphomicrobiales bacterium]
MGEPGPPTTLQGAEVDYVSQVLASLNLMGIKREPFQASLVPDRWTDTGWLGSAGRHRLDQRYETLIPSALKLLGAPSTF